jgi:hypothetical protein
MFTRTQLAFLRISALVCGGFILGLVAVSLSINPIARQDIDVLEDTDTVQRLNDSDGVVNGRAERRRKRVGTMDCSNLNCIVLRKSYQVS